MYTNVQYLFVATCAAGFNKASLSGGLPLQPGAIRYWWRAAAFVKPRWGLVLGGSHTQGALRDPGLWSGTPSAFGWTLSVSASWRLLKSNSSAIRDVNEALAKSVAPGNLADIVLLAVCSAATR